MHLVIVGNGVAGMEAALGARRLSPEATITLVSEETDHFFSRPALMYLLAGQLRLEDTEPLERDAYARHRFARVRGRASGLDVAHKRLLLEGAEALSYDRLLIASGSRPRPGPWPGSELRGVGAFVTMADLAWLEDELGLARSGAAPLPGPLPYGAREPARRGGARRPVVVGGGLIGIEVVETLVALGHRPRFLVREEWFWPMALDAREARFIAEHLRAHGVDVHLGTTVERLVGDGAVQAVETTAGRFECDLVVIAIGVAPNTGWLGDALVLSEHGGIRVDAGLGASAPDVLAAGDCAAVPWRDGTHRPEPLWYSARDQGRVAGRRLAGHEARYERGTLYNSAKLFDVELTTVGELGTSQTRHELFFLERGAVRSTLRLAFGERGLLGANLLGRRWDHAVFRRWIDEGKTDAFVLAHLSDAAFDTELVPPLAVTEWERS
jgi:NADPH-dependent 2,4-dienoyl-CoA reductase/sulfur reductase-like enzyme